MSWLKCIRANFTFFSRSEKLNQTKTHFLSHFKKKKKSKNVYLHLDSNLQSVDLKAIVLTNTP